MNSNLLQDLRYAFRQLRTQPAFACATVLTLALGIGAVTGIFTVVNGVLLRPLPYQDSGRIVTLWQVDSKQGNVHQRFSPANFLDLRENSTLFDVVAAVQPYGFDFRSNGEPEEWAAGLVSKGFFEILVTPALHGRTFLESEYLPGQDKVVILGHALWTQRFGGDPSVVGQRLELDGKPRTVVGVMPSGFGFPPDKRVWAPRPERDSDTHSRRSTYFSILARVDSHAGLDQAKQELDVIAERLADQYPEANGGVGMTAVPLKEHLVGRARPALLIFLGAVALLLMVATANVSGLLMARAIERRREFGVRAALGASRSRLITQLLIENLVLGLTGGALGVVLSFVAVRVFLALSPGLPRLEDSRLDSTTLVFATAIAVGASLLFGLIPSLTLIRQDLRSTLSEGRHGSAGPARTRLRDAFVIAELALALILLVGAGLLMRSFVNLLAIDPGFRTDNVLAIQVFPDMSDSQRTQFYDESLRNLGALPGVVDAAGVLALPFSAESDIDIDPAFVIEGQPVPSPENTPVAHLYVSTPNYFSVMGVPLLKGRFFRPGETAGQPLVAVINSTMARRFWGGLDPLGSRVNLSYGAGLSVEIVGVVQDVRHSGLESDPRPEIYLPYGQGPSWSMTFVVRTRNDPMMIVDPARVVLRDAGYRRPIDMIETLDKLVAASVSHDRFNAVLLTSFSAVALVLAAVGLYGLISYSVRQRAREIGIRLALAAHPRDILRLILGHGVRLVVVGLAVGLFGAFLLTRFMDGLLFEIGPADPLTFGLVSLFLGAVALVATYVPARRALRVDPVTALRYE